MAPKLTIRFLTGDPHAALEAMKLEPPRSHV